MNTKQNNTPHTMLLRRRLTFVVLTALMLTAVASCRSKRAATRRSDTAISTGVSQTTATSPKDEKTVVATPAAATTADSNTTAAATTTAKHTKQAGVAANVISLQPDYESLNISKMTATINIGSKQLSSSVSCKMVRGQWLIFSIQPVLGIELFRIEATTKHLRVIDKVNRRYAEMTFGEIAQKTNLNITLNDLQDLLCARLVAVGNKHYFKEKKTPWTEASASQGYTICFTENKIGHTFGITPDYYIRSVDLERDATHQVHVDYDLYQPLDAGHFPMYYQISAQLADRHIVCTCDIKRIKAEKVSIDAYDVKKMRKVELTDIFSL